MAGAQLSLGLCADATDDDDLLELVEQIIQNRFFEAAGYEDRGDDETENGS
jgi:hypothetical protein